MDEPGTQLDELLNRTHADCTGMSAGIDEAISSVQQWRLEQQAQLERQLEQLRQEVENAPPPSLPTVSTAATTKAIQSLPRTPALRPSSSGGRDENVPCAGGISSRPLSAVVGAAGRFPPRSASVASPRSSVPAGSAVLAARAAMLSLEEEQAQQRSESGAATSTVISTEIGVDSSVDAASKARQEELASEAAAISASFNQMEHKLFDFSSGLDDVLDRLDRLQS